jgi:hypothetical protein
MWCRKYRKYVLVCFISLSAVRVDIGINRSLNFVYRPVFYRALNNETFRKLDKFPTSYFVESL